MKLADWMRKRRRATLPSNQTYWQQIFELSKVNGADYREDRLPLHHFDFPRNTYLQRKLERRDG